MIASWYFKLLAQKPGYVLVSVSLLAFGSISLLGIYGTMPDFRDPTLGFETRGTNIAERTISWNHLFRPLVNAARLFQQPDHVLEKAHSDWENKRRKGKKSEHTKSGKSDKRRLFREQKAKRLHDQQQLDNVADDSGAVVINRFTSDATSDAEIESARLQQRMDESAEQQDGSKSRGKFEFVTMDDDYEAVFDDQSSAASDTGNEVWPAASRLSAETRDQQVRHDDLSMTAHLLYNYCNEPTADHARVGMKRIGANRTESLFEVHALRAMCRLELHITRLPAYQARCEKHASMPGHPACCHWWSLPSYVALINQLRSCIELQPEHLLEAQNLLKECRPYYLDGRLRPNCSTHECHVPKACRLNNAAYNTLHYLMNMGAMDGQVNSTGTLNVSEVLMFMPFAKSSQMIELYEQLKHSTLANSDIGVVAMDLGMDDALFDTLLMRDTLYIYLGGVFILVCIWFYTRSVLMTVFTLVAIIYSLAIAVFVYMVVLGMEFFPFMNVLAVLVNVGIGADDVFIYMSMWRSTCASLDDPPEQEISVDKLAAMIRTTLRHAAISMGVTSVTTACAFLTSWFNSITTIKCFGLFAGITVVCNYLIMVTWIPACVSLLYRLNYSRIGTPPTALLSRVQRATNVLTATIVTVVTKQRKVWIALFGLLFACSLTIVFVYPRFRLATDGEHFRMFAAGHPFEVYQREFTTRFHFEETSRKATGEALLPLTFVWGVQARDNGIHSDPNARGTMELDRQFEPYAVDTQQWLRKFCQNVRQQPFYNADAEEPAVSMGCVVETFDAQMQRACVEPMTRADRTPCCNVSQFPYKPDVFRECLPAMVMSVYATPRDIFPGSMAGPMFGAVTINASHLPWHGPAVPAVVVEAIVLEFDSNVPHSASFERIDRLVDDVQTWFAGELATAPAHMQAGWFTSDLQLYDLQRTLYYDTLTGIVVSLAVACAVLVLATGGDLLLSLCAFVTIIASIGSTVAGLVLLNWRLNVLESIAISTSIGLAIDCSLHYALAYREPAVSEGTRQQRATYALHRMVGPTAMAALTTGAAGVFMMPSQVLPYIQMGEILVLLMVVSWLYATFFLMALLATCGPEGTLPRWLPSWWLRRAQRRNAEEPAPAHEREPLSPDPNEDLESVVQEANANAPAQAARALGLSRMDTEEESLSASTPTIDAMQPVAMPEVAVEKVEQTTTV